MVMGSSMQKVRPKEGTVFPGLNLHGEGNTYHVDLSQYLDLSEVKLNSFSLKLDSESKGKIGTFKDTFSEHTLVTPLEGTPQQLVRIDKSAFLVSQGANLPYLVIDCRAGSDLSKCTSKALTTSPDYVFQAAKIHESNKYIFLVFLKSDNSKIRVEVLDRGFADDKAKCYGTPLDLDTDSVTVGNFKNRINMEVIYSNTAAGRLTQLLLFDQETIIRKDDETEKKITILQHRLFKEGEKEGCLGELSAADIPHSIYDRNKQIDK
jgi:hypothetical protein